MTSTFHSTKTSRQIDSASELRLKAGSRRRRPLLGAASLALLALCTALFSSLYVRAGNQMSVLEVTHEIPVGSSVLQDDLGITRLSMAPGTSFIPANQIDSVVGRKASVALVPGGLLVRGDLTDSYSPPSGSALVGVAIKPGQEPASGVEPGDTVDVLLTGAPGDPVAAVGNAMAESGSTAPSSSASSSDQVSPNTTAGSVLAPDSQVLDVEPVPSSSGSDGVVVSLLVPSTLAPLVSAASAAQQAAIILVAPGS